mgnify:CR=1 FL=1
MPRVTIQHVTSAVKRMDCMTLEHQAALADRVHDEQPCALLTVLAMSQDGVSCEELDHALHVLFVTHLACVESVKPGALPLITKESIDAGVKNYMDLLRYLENEPDRACWDAAFRSHPEPNLLAYAVHYLRDHGINVAVVDHHFGLMLIMLSLVNLYANAVNGNKLL